MAEEQAKWYVIHTYSGYEAMVKDNLEKLIENNNLQDHIVDIQIPRKRPSKKRRTARKNWWNAKNSPATSF